MSAERRVEEGHVEAASVECDDGLVMPGNVPEGGEEFHLIHKGTNSTGPASPGSGSVNHPAV